MKYKNEKGITIISLIVTIFMLAIISATAVYYSRSLGKTAKIENLKANMLLIQAQAKIISEKYNYDKDSVTINLEERDEEGFYQLYESDLEKMGLEDVVKNMRKNNDTSKYYVRYAIDPYMDTYIDVKYTPGMTYEGKNYQKLSEIINAGL